MPTLPRLYTDLTIHAGATLELGAEAAGYLGRVLRRGAGDRVRLFNAQDGEWLAAILSATTRSMAVEVDKQLRMPPRASDPALTLLFAPVKKDATDLIIEKATELGAVRIRPVLTARTQARSVRAERFSRISIEAAEQTERLDLPEILDVMPLDAALAALPDGTVLVFCDEAGEEDGAPWGGNDGRAGALAEALPALMGRDTAILIGPEGGFTAQERAALRGRVGTVPVSLGPRILRAETAVIAAMALWQAVCGDWRET